MFSRMGSAAFKKDLTNIRVLCDRLGQPQTRFKTIHVGGTNGKGSVSHMLAAILQTAGYKTGLYTSPHLYDFRERIKVDGQMAGEDFVVDFIDRIKPAIEEIEPSFFEITVAMAFEYFARQKVGVAVIEVGLGGRLDSTNIITPELSVITNIGWDHMNMLGNTLEQIAAEKAGIIKENIPVVIGEKHPETQEVFQRIAEEKKAPLIFAEESYQPVSYRWSGEHFILEVSGTGAKDTRFYELDLPGIYQRKNLSTVLAATDILIDSGFQISTSHIITALKNVKQATGLLGRWEVIHHHPTIVLEVAHNKEGIEQMLQHVQTMSYNKLHLVLGMVKDKDITKVLELLPKEAVYYYTQAHIPRALGAANLKEKGVTFQLYGDAYENVNSALQQVVNVADENDLVIVCGSIFLVAEVDRGGFGLERMNTNFAGSGTIV